MAIQIVIVFVTLVVTPAVVLVPLWNARVDRWGSALNLVIAAAFTVWIFYAGRWDMLLYPLRYVGFTIAGQRVTEKPVALRFPLEDGDRYYVAHGGSRSIVNYHNSYEPQQFALDIVELNRSGRRAAGLFPNELPAYEIF